MKNWKLCCFGFATMLALFSCQKQKAPLTYFPLDDVQLLDSPFKNAQEVNKEYLLTLNPDRLLAPYRKEAGLQPLKESYTNWENTGLDGHIAGHYLSALSLMYASTHDEAIKERLQYMIAQMKEVQDANGDGYIGGVPGGKDIWMEIAAGNIKADPFSLNGRWVPLYNIHKVYAGLRDAWLYAGSEEARDMLIAMTDWMETITANLSDEQVQDMLRSEYGGLNETFADVAAITNNPKYLTLAERFSHRQVLDPLLNEEDNLTGMHANTQIPKVLGFMRVGEVENNQAWKDASRFFWETVTHNRSVCIGGNSEHEHFNPVDNFDTMLATEQGPETCNTYNMLRLTKMLYAQNPNSAYADYYERALYNHILSTQHPQLGGLVYFTPMRPDHYRVYSQPETSMWCCVGSGIENHSKYAEMIYANQNDDLFVNLFIPSVLNWQEKGVQLVQTNRFPQESATSFEVNPDKPTRFSLNIRYPQWSKSMEVKVNGEPQLATPNENGYVVLNRKWNKGDRVDVQMDMQLAAEVLPDESDYCAVLYGPVVLAARTGTQDMIGLFADDSRGGHIAQGAKTPVNEIPTVEKDKASLLGSITPVAGKPLHFVLPTSAGAVELEPFYGIHESRYTIYWPTATNGSVVDECDKYTIDLVNCGQQQPESDHFVRFEDSEIGYSQNSHWRQTSKWFSYEMRNPNKAGVCLMITYLNNGETGRADVFVDNNLVGQIVEKSGDKGKSTILIPLATHTPDKFSLKVVAENGAITPKITQVKVLSKIVEIE